jgi:hypothetical protein
MAMFISVLQVATPKAADRSTTVEKGLGKIGYFWIMFSWMVIGHLRYE